MSDDEKIAAVAKVLENLPPTAKRAFILMRYDGLSIEEAAQRMKLRKKKINRLVARAFAACQSAIDRVAPT